MDKSLNRVAASATLHCLTGCAIGEIVGMVVSTAASWRATPSVILSVVLAFGFGYSLSMLPLLKHGLGMKRSLRLALASDTASIGTMEFADNLFILAVPGAIHATLSSWLFWWSLTISLALAFGVAYPVNRWLIARGKGHAVVHEHHH
jgi:hypothetical protein